MKCNTPLGYHCKEHQIRHTSFWSWFYPFFFSWDKFQKEYTKKQSQRRKG